MSTNSEETVDCTQLSRMRDFNAELDRIVFEQFDSERTAEEILIEATATVARVLNVKRVSVWCYSDNHAANAMAGDREKYLAAGMDDYISKPIEMKMLKQKLDGTTPSIRVNWSVRSH